MIRAFDRRSPTAWTDWTVAVTGMTAEGGKPAPGLAVARCLRETYGFRGRVIGLGVDVLDAGLHHAGLCDAGYLIPHPSEGAEALEKRLREIQGRERIDAMIPCRDDEIVNLIALKNRLGIRAILPDESQWRLRAMDRLPEACRRIGVRFARTRRIADVDAFDQLAGEGWRYPLVLKAPDRTVHIVHGPAEAKARYGELAATSNQPIEVQAFIPGSELGLMGLGDGAGERFATVAMRKHDDPGADMVWSGVTVIDRELEEVAGRLIKALRWPGPFEIKARRSGNGALYLIAFNPRPASWVYLSHVVGRNLPANLLRMMAGARKPVLAPARAGTAIARRVDDRVAPARGTESLLWGGGIEHHPVAFPVAAHRAHDQGLSVA